MRLFCCLCWGEKRYIYPLGINAQSLLKTLHFTNKHLVIILLLGTVVRLFYGVKAQSWDAAADQVAWGVLLEELIQGASLRYDQLIHYPHEGGSVLMSLLAWYLAPFRNFLPPLSAAVLLVDFIARGVQLLVVRKVFDNSVTWLFGLWTILAVPQLIPWATVNLGLHAVAACFPFLFLYLLTREKPLLEQSVLSGLLVGAAVAFSYDNLVLIPAFLVIAAFRKDPLARKFKAAALFAGSIVITVTPHVWARLFLDNAFELTGFDAMSVRGTDCSGGAFSERWLNLLQVWYQALVGASTMPAFWGIPNVVVRIVWLLICLVGLGLGLAPASKLKSPFKIGLVVAVVFVLMYALSPFYTSLNNAESYTTYRHFSYILPLLVVLSIAGMLQSKQRPLLLPIGLMFLSVLGSATFIATAAPKKQSTSIIAGWVLAKKIGHDTKRLKKVASLQPPEIQRELINGAVWGLTSTILENVDDPYDPKVDQLVLALRQFLPENAYEVENGVRHSFSEGLTPQLNPVLLPELLKRLGY